MSQPLPERTQRLFFVALVAGLVFFGIYLSLGGFDSGDEETPPPPAQDQGGADPGGADRPPAGTGATVPPSPIPTTDVEDMAVLDWLPFTEQEFRAAAATAQGFAEAYGTIDYTRSPEEYYAAMEELATEEYAEVLARSSGAGAFWGERAEAGAVAEGRADVLSIRDFGDDSVTFVVRAQSITETADSEFDENLGEFAVTVQRSGTTWRVFDFQPADAGQYGEE